MYVGTEVVSVTSPDASSILGLTLTDIIASTLPITEVQAATVLKQVGQIA
jgi:hypothetical protein